MSKIRQTFKILHITIYKINQNNTIYKIADFKARKNPKK